MGGEASGSGPHDGRVIALRIDANPERATSVSCAIADDRCRAALYVERPFAHIEAALEIFAEERRAGAGASFFRSYVARGVARSRPAVIAVSRLPGHSCNRSVSCGAGATARERRRGAGTCCPTRIGGRVGFAPALPIPPTDPPADGPSSPAQCRSATHVIRAAARRILGSMRSKDPYRGVSGSLYLHGVHEALSAAIFSVRDRRHADAVLEARWKCGRVENPHMP